MTTWTEDELDRIGTSEELEIASLRQDNTLQKPRTIWVVRVDNDLYARSVNGRESDWFHGVLKRHAGKIFAGGIEKDVIFIESNDPTLHDLIDTAYRNKYSRFPKQYVDACLTPQAKDATIRLIVRDKAVADSV